MSSFRKYNPMSNLYEPMDDFYEPKSESRTQNLSRSRKSIPRSDFYEFETKRKTEEKSIRVLREKMAYDITKSGIKTINFLTDNNADLEWSQIWTDVWDKEVKMRGQSRETMTEEDEYEISAELGFILLTGRTMGKETLLEIAIQNLRPDVVDIIIASEKFFNISENYRMLLNFFMKMMMKKPKILEDDQFRMGTIFDLLIDAIVAEECEGEVQKRVFVSL